MRSPAVRVFSARACASPLLKAAERFRRSSGIAVEMQVCSRHCHQPIASSATAADVTGLPHFLTEVAEIEGLDIVISGAGYLTDDAEIAGILDPRYRVCLGYRRAALLVQPGNPKGITRLADLERPDVTAGISVIDCLKGVYEDLLSATHRSERMRPRIGLRTNGCVALVEALAQRKVDVAIGWSAFQHLNPAGVQVVPIEESRAAIERETTASLRRLPANAEGAIRFLEFLRNGNADDLLAGDGWIVPEWRGELSESI